MGILWRTAVLSVLASAPGLAGEGAGGLRIEAFIQPSLVPVYGKAALSVKVGDPGGSGAQPEWPAVRYGPP